jgi:hypothetical protein
MQRILFALVAFISLLIVNVRPSSAQLNGRAVEPTAAPQTIDEPADGKPRVGSEKPVPSAPEWDGKDTYVLKPGQSVPNLVMRDTPMVLEGHVAGDVLAINSDVTIKPGATVGGSLVAVGGSVHNKAGASVKVVQQNPEIANLLATNLPEENRVPADVDSRRDDGENHPHNWFGGQLALLGLGIVGGLILLMIAPRATYQMATMVSLEPARCLVVGGISAAALLVALGFNSLLMHSPLRFFWTPFSWIVALGAALLLACGWLCGLRFVGDFVARKLGRADSQGRIYTRMALGLGAFFLLNIVLGAIGMCGVGLFAEFVVALMGLGAFVISGGGKDPDWLGSRLRGETRWFARKM